MSSSTWDKYYNPLTPDAENALTELIIRGGDGDHLEIGSLFGASAIHAARAKQHRGLGGKVVCIDPFDPALLTPTIRAQCSCNPTPEILLENAAAFGVADRIEVIRAKSNPLPTHIRRFATAFIDGDHTFEAVWNDWLNVGRVTDIAVLFDDDIPHLGPYWLARHIFETDHAWLIGRYLTAHMVLAVRK